MLLPFKYKYSAMAILKPNSMLCITTQNQTPTTISNSYPIILNKFVINI